MPWTTTFSAPTRISCWTTIGPRRSSTSFATRPARTPYCCATRWHCKHKTRRICRLKWSNCATASRTAACAGTALRTFPFLRMTGAFAIRYLIASRGIEPKERAFLLGTYIRDYPICSGPLYIKLCQILATPPDLSSSHVRSRLVTLQDDVPPMTERDLDAVLVRNYEPGPSNIFSTFSRTPIASASIAQV